MAWLARALNLYCLTSFYNEPVESLTQAITDAIDIGCTHVIALDGAYAHFPHLEPLSPEEQRQAIRDVCRERGVPCWVDGFTQATEAQKRTRLFDMAYEMGATPDDWVFVQDADQTITHKQDIKPLLQGDVMDVLGIEGDTKRFTDTSRRRWPRLAYRALPGLHVHPDCHWWYMDDQGRILWGYNCIESGGRLPIVVHNHSERRASKRRRDRDRYYSTRARDGVEQHLTPLSCYECDQPWVRGISVGFHVGMEPDGQVDVSPSRVLFLCEEHLPKWQQRNHDELTKGINRAKYLVHTGDLPLSALKTLQRGALRLTQGKQDFSRA